MTALWIVVIVLAIAVVFMYFRGESTRNATKKLNTWCHVTRNGWMTSINKEHWDLRKMVCDEHPARCPGGDRRDPPPDPPPEFP